MSSSAFPQQRPGQASDKPAVPVSSSGALSLGARGDRPGEPAVLVSSGGALSLRARGGGPGPGSPPCLSVPTVPSLWEAGCAGRGP